MCRGETFRTAFAELRDVCSLLPSNVNIMALTATATKASRRSICRVLGMTKPAIVSQSPNKPNIKYNILAKTGTIEEVFEPMVEEVRRFRTTTDKTIIFCNSYNDCTHMFWYFKSRLGKEAQSLLVHLI